MVVGFIGTNTASRGVYDDVESAYRFLVKKARLDGPAQGRELTKWNELKISKSEK